MDVDTLLGSNIEERHSSVEDWKIDFVEDEQIAVEKDSSSWERSAVAVVAVEEEQLDKKELHDYKMVVVVGIVEE